MMAQATARPVGTQIVVPIGELIPSKNNPRGTFDQARLNELADDIRVHGILQPLLVRPIAETDDGARYQIVAGERRFRAALLVELETVPVYMLPVESDAEALELAISENVNRDQLDPLELAKGYQQLQQLRGLNQEQIGQMVGKSQEVVSRTVSLLKLPEKTQQLIRDGQLQQGHGTALVSFEGFPDVVDSIAHEAAESHAGVRDLQTALPYAQKLEKAGTIRNVPGDLPFAKVCQTKCPFKAYVRSAPNSDFGYCLNPAHFAELTAEAEAKAAAEQAKLKTAAQLPETKGRNPKRGLPMLASMDPATYQRIGNAPTGCTVDCPCRGRGLLSDGATEAAICLDKRRFEKLRRADQRVYDRSVLQTKQAYYQQLEARLDEQPAGAAEIIVMLARCNWRTGAGEHVLARRGLADLFDAETYSAPTEEARVRHLLRGFAEIATRGGVELLARIGAEYIVRTELEISDTLDLPVTSWLLGAADLKLAETATTGAETAPEDDDDAEDVPETGDATAGALASENRDSVVSADPDSEIPGTVEERPDHSVPGEPIDGGPDAPRLDPDAPETPYETATAAEGVELPEGATGVLVSPEDMARYEAAMEADPTYDPSAVVADRSKEVGA